MKDFVAELQWRGMVQDSTPGVQDELNKQATTGYVGFDPTADSLHIGNLVPIMLLMHFQRAGHKPIALVGGATGMVGDPSGKSQERQMLSEEELQHNLSAQEKQLRQFLNFDSGENAAELVNNYDWFKDFGFLDFIREVGKHITVNYMMAKDSVQKRLETGISFTEFSYQLVQGYDFYWLNQHKNCRLQMGGSDQWGNITTGTELIRRKGGSDCFALTCPLLTKADGSKFGKSESGNVWLDPARTSPYKFYQFWRNVDDADLPRLLRFFTLFSKEEIEAMEEEHSSNPNRLKEVLATEVTTRVHGAEETERAQEAAKILFAKGDVTETLRNMPEPLLLEVMEGVPQVELTQADYAAFTDVVELAASDAIVFPSKSEARKMIKGGGFSINKQKISDPTAACNFELLQGKYLLLQKGKKNYYLVKVEG